MKKIIISIILTIICLHTNLFADIAPNPINAKTISPKDAKNKIMIELKNF